MSKDLLGEGAMMCYHIKPVIDITVTEVDLIALGVAAIEHASFIKWEGVKSCSLCVDRLWRTSLTKPLSLEAAEFAAKNRSIFFSLEMEDGTTERFEMNRQRLLHAITKHLSEGAYVRIDDGRWDISDLSDADADCLLQWTLFDDIKYD